MILTWMPPVSLKHLDYVHPQRRHWLVNEEGRILAAVIDPQPDNPEESFDAKLYYTNTNDEAYFISLDHAKEWCEKKSREYSKDPAGPGLGLQPAVSVEAPK